MKLTRRGLLQALGIGTAAATAARALPAEAAGAAPDGYRLTADTPSGGPWFGLGEPTFDMLTERTSEGTRRISAYAEGEPFETSVNPDSPVYRYALVSVDENGYAVHGSPYRPLGVVTEVIGDNGDGTTDVWVCTGGKL